MAGLLLYTTGKEVKHARLSLHSYVESVNRGQFGEENLVPNRIQPQTAHHLDSQDVVFAARGVHDSAKQLAVLLLEEPAARESRTLVITAVSSPRALKTSAALLSEAQFVIPAPPRPDSSSCDKLV